MSGKGIEYSWGCTKQYYRRCANDFDSKFIRETVEKMRSCGMNETEAIFQEEDV